MESNSVDAEKSKKFTEALLKKGFVFPATVIAGNPSTRKEYDEGYLLADSEGKLFHFKQVVGRPYVRFIEKSTDIIPVQAYVAEFRDRSILGLVVDTENNFYVLGSDYGLTKTGLPSFDPSKESLTILGNMLDWTVKVSNSDAEKVYALDASDYSLIKELIFPDKVKAAQVLHFTSVGDKLVKPRLF